MASIISKNVQDALRRHGYSKKRALERRKLYNNASSDSEPNYLQSYGKYIVDGLGKFDVIMIGSRREGLAGFEENDSDVDRLFVPKKIMCTEPKEMLDRTNYDTTFTLEYNGAPAGYAFLKLDMDSIVGTTEYKQCIRDNCFENNDTHYFINNGHLQDLPGVLLNHNNFSENGSQETDECKEPARGPSRPFVLFDLSFDNVLALKCSSHHLKDWCDSKRGKVWPPVKTIRKIRGLSAHVVPVGAENTDNEWMQWRISHCLHELELVKSFNDIQIKVYGMMKFIRKSILEPALFLSEAVCDPSFDTDIGLSYMIKNLLFWLSEKHTANGFTETLFEERVIDMLKELLSTIQTGRLDNYMIPARNICSTKLTAEFRKILEIKIEFLLDKLFTIKMDQMDQMDQMVNSLGMKYFTMSDDPSVISDLNRKMEEERRVESEYLRAVPRKKKWLLTDLLAFLLRKIRGPRRTRVHQRQSSEPSNRR